MKFAVLLKSNIDIFFEKRFMSHFCKKKYIKDKKLGQQMSLINVSVNKFVPLLANISGRKSPSLGNVRNLKVTSVYHIYYLLYLIHIYLKKKIKIFSAIQGKRYLDEHNAYIMCLLK